MEARRYRVDILIRRAVGRVIEMLGNEALLHLDLREVAEPKLTQECTLYALRLLVLHFAEGRRNHGIKGMSALRRLEEMSLVDDERTGFLLHDELDKLFVSARKAIGPTTIFDLRAMPHLSKLKFRSGTLQQALWLLSTDLDGSRLDYGTIGVNVLGSVSEYLLSGRGHVLTEPTIEVHEKGMKLDDEAVTYFVPAGRLEEFDEDEVVRDSKGRPVIYGAG